jgi:hypothetical protein
MTDVEYAPYPDRELRPGGRWSTPDLVDELLRLATLERAVAHITNGLIPKLVVLDDKIVLSDGLEAAMGRAMTLRHHALTLLERDPTALWASRSWIEPLRRLDADPDPLAILTALRGDVAAFALGRYRGLAERLDPLYDTRLLGTIGTAIDAIGAAAVAAPLPGPVAEALTEAWADPAPERVGLEETLWAPVGRVPSPGRPTDVRPEPGSRGHLRAISRFERSDMMGELNENLIAELCAMELLSRSSYEHPDLPWAFHASLARHSTDEGRHAEIFRRLLADIGVHDGDMPQHATNYEFAYEFPDCELGSKRELLWRLLLMCTVLEALAIDKMLTEIATRDHLGQLEFARALDYIFADELFHAENGLKLTRQLGEQFGFDTMLERELVHGRFFGRQYDVRKRYLDADPERAEREKAIMGGPDPDDIRFGSRTEVELRKRASFTDEECEQVTRWGYNPRSTPSMSS